MPTKRLVLMSLECRWAPAVLTPIETTSMTARPGVEQNARLFAFTSSDPADQASNYAASIHWNDGTAPSGATITRNADGRFQVTGTHTFPKPGGFNLRVSLAHADGSPLAEPFGTSTVAMVANVVSDTLAVGAGAGGSPHVTVYNADGSRRFSFLAYEAGFTGGVSVATGDITGDGIADTVTGAGPGGGPHVKIFDGATGELLRSFFAFDGGFRGGVHVAVGQINMDGYADVVVGAGAGGGPHVRAFDIRNNRMLNDFFAYSPQFTGGVRVAVADMYGIAFGKIVTGAGPGGGPHVQVIDAFSGLVYRSYYAFDKSYTGGVYVASDDMTGDGWPDVIVSQGEGSQPRVRVFDHTTAKLLDEFPAFSTQKPIGGARVATIDRNDDGVVEIIVAAGRNNGPLVRTFLFDNDRASLIGEFAAFDPAYLGGVFVG